MAFIEIEKSISGMVNDACSVMLKETNDAFNAILTRTVANSENLATLIKVRLKNLEMSVISNITHDLSEEPQYNAMCSTPKRKKVIKKIKSFQESKNYVCEECGKEFSDLAKLKRHHKTLHLKLKDERCTECDYCTSDKSTLISHIEKLHPYVKMYECELCGHSELRKKAIRGHYEKVHNITKMNDFRTTGYGMVLNCKSQAEQCPYCDFIFPDPSLLMEHVASIHQESKYL